MKIPNNCVKTIPILWNSYCKNFKIFFL